MQGDSDQTHSLVFNRRNTHLNYFFYLWVYYPFKSFEASMQQLNIFQV